MAGGSNRIDARVPLALLRAIQNQDARPELQPDEHPIAPFPHRLGLSGVIEGQIRHFRRLARLRRGVEEQEVRSLLELISRRSDADAVFSNAGRQLAQFHLSGPAGRVRRLARRLPARVRRRSAVRALRTAHGVFLAAAELSVEAAPLEVRATDALSTRLSEYEGTCALYAALTAGLLAQHGFATQDVLHPECQLRGDACCVWKVESMD